MSRRNKFGIEAPEDPAPRRPRKPGPMGVAIRDTAQTVGSATEEKIEQRRRNAADAKTYRAALDAGHVLTALPLDAIRTDDLPRDRLDLDDVATADEMDELKASIRARGQREPVEVYRDGEGAYQLVSGWRRLHALRQLREETGDDAYATITARIAGEEEDRLARYLDMVEENVIREDLTFAEMAQLAIAAAADPAFEGEEAGAMVGRLYASLHKVKRSYIRSFVLLLETLGDVLGWPKAIPRNLGVEAARALRAAPEMAEELRAALAGAADAEAQNAILRRAGEGGAPKAPATPRAPKQKFEFHMDDMKITARRGECRITGPQDYTAVSKDRLEKAIAAFRKALSE